MQLLNFHPCCWTWICPRKACCLAVFIWLGVDPFPASLKCTGSFCFCFIWLKSNDALNLLELQVTENKDFIQRKREVVSFSPNDKTSTESFLRVQFSQLVQCFYLVVDCCMQPWWLLLRLLRNFSLSAGWEEQRKCFIHTILCIHVRRASTER
jgi:hypothetical protein